MSAKLIHADSNTVGNWDSVPHCVATNTVTKQKVWLLFSCQAACVTLQTASKRTSSSAGGSNQLLSVASLLRVLEWRHQWQQLMELLWRSRAIAPTSIAYSKGAVGACEHWMPRGCDLSAAQLEAALRTTACCKGEHDLRCDVFSANAQTASHRNCCGTGVYCVAISSIGRPLIGLVLKVRVLRGRDICRH
jgi:hypothetical protein